MAFLSRVLLLGLMLAASAHAALEENDVKAAVVYHLSLFADWPGAWPGGQFQLCAITEDDNMAAALARLHGKTVKNIPLRVTRKRPEQDLSACQLVYVGMMSESSRQRVVAQVSALPVLTVVNGGIPVAGSIVSIGVVREKVVFDIDLPAAQRVGLRLDSRVLRLARSVSR